MDLKSALYLSYLMNIGSYTSREKIVLQSKYLVYIYK